MFSRIRSVWVLLTLVIFLASSLTILVLSAGFQARATIKMARGDAALAQSSKDLFWAKFRVESRRTSMMLDRLMFEIGYLYGKMGLELPPEK